MHCLEKPSKGLKYLIEIIETWIIPFLESLADEDELVENFKLCNALHKMIDEMMKDLTTQFSIENHLDKSNWSFIIQKVCSYNKSKNDTLKLRSKRLSLKRKRLF